MTKAQFIASLLPGARPTGLVMPTPFPDAVFEAVKDRIFSQVPSATPE
jgi:hypothetical protein